MKPKSRRDVLKATAATALAAGTGNAEADFALVRSLPVIIRRITDRDSDYK